MIGLQKYWHTSTHSLIKIYVVLTFILDGLLFYPSKSILDVFNPFQIIIYFIPDSTFSWFYLCYNVKFLLFLFSLYLIWRLSSIDWSIVYNFPEILGALNFPPLICSVTYLIIIIIIIFIIYGVTLVVITIIIILSSALSSALFHVILLLFSSFSLIFSLHLFDRDNRWSWVRARPQW